MVNKEPLEDKIFFSKYKPEKKIGEGSFGQIYSASHIQTNEKFALKLENKNTGQSLLESEAYVLCYLKGEGIPAIKSYGFSGDHNVLVMELLGKSLEDLFQDCGCKFSLKCVCLIADQMVRLYELLNAKLKRIEYVHSKHIIHRDIKPDNFLIGTGEFISTIYVIDFGLAKKYRSSRTLQHIKCTNNKKLTGTARYASINALRGYEQSRRDDLEAIGYVLLYFLRGSLPWQGLKVNKREDRYKKIYEKKKSTTAEELSTGFPNEFADYITYTRNLAFEADPDYEYLRGLFANVMNKNNFQYDYDFDWRSKLAQNDTIKEKNIPTTSTEQNAGKNGGWPGTSHFLTQPNSDNNQIEPNAFTKSNPNLHSNNNPDNLKYGGKFQVNQTNYKFIETLNNAERIHTAGNVYVKKIPLETNQNEIRRNNNSLNLKQETNFVDAKATKPYETNNESSPYQNDKPSKDSKCFIL